VRSKRRLLIKEQLKLYPVVLLLRKPQKECRVVLIFWREHFERLPTLHKRRQRDFQRPDYLARQP